MGRRTSYIVSEVLLHALVQNDDGSFGAYELTRSYEWLEVSIDRHIGIYYCFVESITLSQSITIVDSTDDLSITIL
jgi:hypothetical protein